jgi:hypothetical protein
MIAVFSGSSKSLLAHPLEAIGIGGKGARKDASPNFSLLLTFARYTFYPFSL